MLFDKTLQTLVMSSFSNFMVSAATQSKYAHLRLVPAIMLPQPIAKLGKFVMKIFLTRMRERRGREREGATDNQPEAPLSLLSGGWLSC